MAYKPPVQTITDNDLKNIPSSEAIFEALKLKVDEPTISGSTGQLLQLDGYVSGEAVTSWVNPPSALPSQTGNTDKVLATNGSTASWQYAGLGAGSLGTGNVILGRAKPTNITTSTDAVIIGSGASDSLTTGSRNITIGGLAGQLITTGNNNIAIGQAALQSVTTAGNMVAIGLQAGQSVTTASANVFIGDSAGRYNTAGANTFIGAGAATGVSASSTGGFNTALGRSALAALTTGSNNVAIGARAGDAISTGNSNVSIGLDALGALTTSSENIAIGQNAALALTVAPSNTVIGHGVLAAYNQLTFGGGITAIGFQAAAAATTCNLDDGGQGRAATIIGYQACQSATNINSVVAIGYRTNRASTAAQGNTCVGTLSGNSGNSNTALGFFALTNVTSIENVGCGRNALSNLTSGSQNTGLGTSSGANVTTGSNNVFLGYGATGFANNTNSAISLGRDSVAASNEMAIGSASYQINTMLLGRGGASQTVANAVKIQTMRASGTDTDMSVGTLTIAGAQGTGTGAGGDVIIATAAPAVSSGSSLNAHVEVMRVTDNGLVGIGTSTPTEKLEVNGNIKGGTISFNADANRQATLTNLGFLTNTKTHDFGSLSHGDEEETTITVTGAAVGDVCFVGAPSTIEIGLSWDAYVSAADTVTLRVYNYQNSGSIDPASATWRVTVLKT